MREEAKKGEKKGFNILSGKALFKYDPTLFKLSLIHISQGIVR